MAQRIEMVLIDKFKPFPRMKRSFRSKEVLQETQVFKVIAGLTRLIFSVPFLPTLNQQSRQKA